VWDVRIICFTGDCKLQRIHRERNMAACQLELDVARLGAFQRHRERNKGIV
jgi:hypothetical protein